MMSSNYSADQYESAYKSQRLQNWCVSKPCKLRPTALEGHTTFIANDRGHLMPGVAKKGRSWPDFKGTWDLPARLHPQCINPTSRSVEGLNRLQARGVDPKCTSTTLPQDGSKDTASPYQVGTVPICKEHDQGSSAPPPGPRRTPPATDPTPQPPATAQSPACCSVAEGPGGTEGRQHPQHTGGVSAAERTAATGPTVAAAASGQQRTAGGTERLVKRLKRRETPESSHPG